MRVVRQTYADGSMSGLLKMHDDGSTRPLPEDDPSYLSWLADGGVVEIVPYVAPDLDASRAAAVQQIDSRAEALRLTVITPGAGQMAAYLRKEAQARAYLAATVPTDPEALAAFEAAYAAIYGEVGITADTPREVARIIVANADAWFAFGDAIERARLAGKQAVQAAQDQAAIDAAVAAIVWPTA